MSQRIVQTFTRCKTESRAAFIPFIMGGDPTLDACAALLDARYSRDMEAEADAYGARMLRANSLSPALLATMLERLEASRRPDDANEKKDGKDDSDGVGGYLRSHPATEERIRALRRPTAN